MSAFISYRHSKPDPPVALALAQRLRPQLRVSSSFFADHEIISARYNSRLLAIPAISLQADVPLSGNVFRARL